MPVYEYRCSQCEKEFEYQQRMSEPAKTTCEACGGGLERLISRTAFQFKGGGWYKDLYASAKPEAKAGDAKAGEAKAGEAKAETKAEPKKTGGDSSGGTSGGGSGTGTTGGGSTGSSGGGSTTSANAA